MGHRLVIKPGLATTMTTSDTPPTLKEMQVLVGGYVEHIGQFTDKIGEPIQFYCNEDGRIIRLANNPVATALLQTYFRCFDHMLVGPIVVLSGRDVIWR